MITIHIPTVLLCVAYMFIGPALILLNKYILHNLSFPYPMFLSGLGVLVSGLVAQILVRSGYVSLQRKEAVEGALWYKRVLPVGLAHAGTLAFGNTVYLLLNVGFIQMLKSFTPVIIMFTAYLAGIEKPSRPVIISILVISIGTAATCSFTPQLSFVGVFVMFMAEATEAIRLVLTQFLLQNLKFGVIEGQYVLAPATAFWLFLTSAVYEFPSMVKAGAFSTVFLNPMTFLAASTMGLAVNFLTYLVIQATSSLTMKVLGTVRNIFTIFLGAMFYTEVISGNEILGYSIALGGFAAYNVAKSGYWDHKPTSLLPVDVGDDGKAENKGETTPKKAALQGLGLKGLEASTDDGDVESSSSQSQPLLAAARNGLGGGAGGGGGGGGVGALSSRALSSLPQLQVKLDMTTSTTNQKKG